MRTDDGELDIVGLVGGDRQSWKKFVNRYAPIIYSTVIKLLKTHCGRADPDQAADLTQVVFMNLVKDNYRLLRNFDARKASMTTWLRLIARSRSLDVMRKRRIVTESLDSSAHEPRAPVRPAMPEIDIPDNLLSARQMLIMRLLFDKDMEVLQVARLLKISAQTVRSTKHKALTKLRIYFANIDRDPNTDD